MTKKLLIISIVVITLILMGVLAFYFFGQTDSRSGSDTFDGSPLGFIFGNFGNDGNQEVVDGNFDTENITIDEERPLLRLRKISSSPTTGFIVFENSDNVVSIRYSERATGHIYEANTENATIKRVSNTTIPRIYETVWLDKGSLVYRYLDEKNTIKSFYAEVIEKKQENEAEGEIEGVFLRDDIDQIIPYGSKILSLYPENNTMKFVVSDGDGGNGFGIYNSSLKDLIAQRVSPGVISLTTKSSNSFPGYMFLLDVNSGSLTKILERINGLTTLTNGLENRVLFSKGVDLYVRNIDEEKDKNLRVKGLAEKCVWFDDDFNLICGIPEKVTRTDYPDAWYKGTVSFSDVIYRIDVEEGVFEKIISPKDFSGEEIDLIKPVLGPNEDYLFFINKKDLSLWSLQIEPSSADSEENTATTTSTE